MRAPLLLAALFSIACSANKNAGSPDDLEDGGDPEDGSIAGDGSTTNDGEPGVEFNIPEEVAPPCVGLKCQQKICPGSATTSVSGTVYDPAGKLPLYNVIVYVPNAPLDPFPKGVSCDKCGTVASGQPIVTALTDAKGRFVLKNVPVGKDIPLVIQVGKWRRKVTIPEVKECVDNALTNPDMTRLPRNRKEGDMPQMAIVTGGCDRLQCLFRKMGIDDSEFTPGTGTGAMHMYAGQGGTGVPGMTPAQPFWSDLTQLKKYDITILSCECSEYPSNKGTTALNAMHGYANAGGRIFATHYHYHWFKSGPPDFQSVANWGSAGFSSGSLFTVDTTFPKGNAFAEWLVNVGASTTKGQITLTAVRNDVTTVNPATSQRWIYKDGPESVKYFSFNTPVGKPVDSQCGKAVFSDIHVSESGAGSFPSGCPTGDLTPQEKALAFLFFDLSSCIQTEKDPPKPPPPK